MIVFISQSNYLPWRGFIDIIRQADYYIVYDSMQYTKNDWRNRNLIRCNDSPMWLSVPCGSAISRSIDQVYPCDTEWNKKHFETIRHCYSKAPHWKVFGNRLAETYGTFDSLSLSEVNVALLRFVLELEGVNTVVVRDTDIMDAQTLLSMDRSVRLAHLCAALSAKVYLSAPAAKGYLTTDSFEKLGIDVKFYNYPKYPGYFVGNSRIERELSWIDPLMYGGGLFNGYD